MFAPESVHNVPIALEAMFGQQPSYRVIAVIQVVNQLVPFFAVWLCINPNA
jgi:hypothetical protein